MGMKRCFYATVLALLLSLCFGIYKSQTYTDASSDVSYLEWIYVAEKSESHAISECEKLSEILPNAPVIARVTVLQEVEHLFHASRQLVQIRNIYQGDALKEGDQIYLTYQGWSLSLYGEPYSLERGFVNLLNQGEDYLVFLGSQADGLGEKTPIYELYGDYAETSIAPVFSCEEHENKIVETGAEHTYVPYNQVSENEFFAESQAALEAMEALKEKMINQYL